MPASASSGSATTLNADPASPRKLGNATSLGVRQLQLRKPGSRALGNRDSQARADPLWNRQDARRLPTHIIRSVIRSTELTWRRIAAQAAHRAIPAVQAR